ncbi:MAG: hypothetical protein LBN18_08330 [Dysgonamonadaceae bacterium]|jgi:hypothetical protein|nr:hypothetical protein [Dysgonamonadaceae bacterium]
MAKHKIYSVVLFTLGIILLTGCSFNRKKEAQNGNVGQTIYSEDDLFSITIPSGWEQITDYDLNDEADIQAQKKFGVQYVVVLTENKEDIDYTFEEWLEKVKGDYLESWETPTISEASDIIIDGQPAKQYEFKGSIDHVNICMIATYVDGEHYFAQILSWTTASKYKSSKEDFEAIANSIRGLK